jgi:hypothetical protein
VISLRHAFWLSSGGRFLLVPTGSLAWLLYRVRVPCTACVRCCSQRLQGGRCCLGRTLTSLLESSVVCAAPVCWLCLVLLRLALCPFCVFWVAFGSVTSLSFLAAHCVCFPRPCELSRLHFPGILCIRSRLNVVAHVSRCLMRLDSGHGTITGGERANANPGAESATACY